MSCAGPHQPHRARCVKSTLTKIPNKIRNRSPHLRRIMAVLSRSPRTHQDMSTTQQARPILAIRALHHIRAIQALRQLGHIRAIHHRVWFIQAIQPLRQVLHILGRQVDRISHRAVCSVTSLGDRASHAITRHWFHIQLLGRHYNQGEVLQLALLDIKHIYQFTTIVI